MSKSVRIALVTICLLVPLVYFGDHHFSRYMSWRSLSPDHIFDASQWYIDNRAQRAGDITAICVYALDCSDNRARLAIVPIPDQYDFYALRQRIWARKFKGVCQGQSANLGLHLLRASDHDQFPYSDHAIWSFYNNRFIPRSGHWSGGAFSEKPWKRCSTDAAAFMARGGQLVKTAR